MNIAIIGLGEVGRAYAKSLKEQGHRLFLCDTRPSAFALDLATSLDLTVNTEVGSWIADCQWILSCVTGGFALQVVEQCLRYAAKEKVILCDLTTATPDTKRASARMSKDYGIGYLDVAIMGSVALGQHKTPLLVAGDSAMVFQGFMGQAGAKVTVIRGGIAGDAISLKILRSVFTKGLEALSVELLMTAERQGVREKLYEQLRDIDETPLRTFIDMLVRTHVVHAKRRAHEVQDASAEMAKHNIQSLVLPGVANRFAKTIAELEKYPIAQPELTIEEALSWLLEHQNRSINVNGAP